MSRNLHGRLTGDHDVTVIGAGVIGLATAFELAEKGRRVLVLERGDVAGVATPAAGGMLAPVAESDVELADLNGFRRFSHSLYPEWIERLQKRSGCDTGFDMSGTLLVAVDRDHREELERLRVIFADQGFPVEWMTAAEVLEREPSLSPRVVCGLDLRQDHVVDTRLLLQALATAVESMGGRILHGMRVDALQADGTLQATCLADDSVHRVSSRDVVLAGGSWSNVGLQGVAAHLPLRPVKGQILRLHGAALLHRVVRTPDIYLIPHRAGHLIVGASVEEQGFDHIPTAGATFDLLRHAWRALPGIYDVSLQEINVGFRPTIRDHRPVIGRLGDSRVVVATGHYRNGILQATGTARLVADLVCDGIDNEWLRAFTPERFSDMATSAAVADPGTTGAALSGGG